LLQVRRGTMVGLVARRALRRGDELTLAPATWCAAGNRWSHLSRHPDPTTCGEL